MHTGKGEFLKVGLYTFSKCADWISTVLASADLKGAKIPPRSPRANASKGGLVLTARTGVSDQMLIFGKRHLRLVLAEYEAHQNGRRPHRGRSSARYGPTTLPPTSHGS